MYTDKSDSEQVNGWKIVMEALKDCSSLKEICDFQWSSTVLGDWEQRPPGESPASTRKFIKNALDLHSKGLGEPKATAVLAGLLQVPRVSMQLGILDIRYHIVVCLM